MKREIYSIWKCDKSGRRNQWKVQFPKGIDSYPTKKSAQAMVDELKRIEKEERRAKLIGDMIVELEFIKSNLDSGIAGLTGCLVGNGWIITLGSEDRGIVIDFDETGKTTTGKCKLVATYRATRLCEEDARMLAPTVKNKAGHTGQATPAIVAMRAELVIVDDMLEKLRK